MVSVRELARDEFEEQARAGRWLKGQTQHSISNGTETATGPALALSAFIGYGRRAKDMLGETGERAGWDAAKFMLDQPFGAGFWRPQFMKWAALYADGETMEAEKYYWTAVFDADQAAGWQIFNYVIDSDVKSLKSGESGWLDEWGMVRTGS